MNNISIKIIVCAFLFINYNVFGSDKTVSVATLKDYAPYVFVQNEKSVTGIVSPTHRVALVEGYSWDIFQESFLAMGYSIKYTVVPWARALLYVKNGQADLIFPISKSDERLRIFDYSEESVNDVGIVMYFPITSTFEWKGYSSINEKIIGVKRGFNYGEKWHELNAVTKSDIGEISVGFQMLEGGYLDGFIGYENSWDYLLKQKGWVNKFKKTAVIDTAIEYVAAMKGADKNNRLLRVYDEGKRIIIENGKLAEIKLKWFGVK